MHKIENVPDHILQEMQNFSIDLAKVVLPMVQSVPPNIALCGLNWMMAAMLEYLVSEEPEELKKAAEQSCIMLLGNVDMIINNRLD